VLCVLCIDLYEIRLDGQRSRDYPYFFVLAGSNFESYQMIEHNKISALYKSYGFDEKKSNIEGVAVFSIRSGHFHNADIILLDPNADADLAFEQFKSSGYACTIRPYKSLEEASESLFQGFFSVNSTRVRHKKEYAAFTKSLVDKYSESATYSYIDVDYMVNGREGELSVVEEILRKIKSDKPILFLIEAAAGFGKTCTSYELLKELINNEHNKTPLFSELSRNRQAKIFKYVLLDEIDRSFPQLNSSLVTLEIRKGNVPVILDGFDELLHRSQDSDGYNNAEPMMETIGELLVGNAKVILTTRRTAIFDGDGFHEWMNAHEEDFDIVRIRLKEPSVDNWLPKERLELLLENNFPINKISNPVLLSFLRCIDEDDFKAALNDPDMLVDKYFDSMLDRERVRQDLRMRPSEQYGVLKSIAEDMIEFNYTAETRDYILSCIVEKNSNLIDETIKNYPRDERPTFDELSNKLASHAFLDRKHEDEQGIGFVNEFVLGSFCADCILADEGNEWAGDQRFIEPCVLSYMPRSINKRTALWGALKFSMEFYEPEKKVISSIMLTNKISLDLIEENISDISINKTSIGGDFKINNSLFIGCTFIEVEFYVGSFEEVSFVNCSFYNCKSINSLSNETIHFINCNSDNDFIDVVNKPKGSMSEPAIDRDKDCEVFVLEKFWPKGRVSFIKHRPIKLICSINNYFNSHEILKALARLKTNEILKVPDKVSFVEINTDKINDIRRMLGR